MRVLVLLGMLVFSGISFAQDGLDFSVFEEETKGCVYDQDKKLPCDCSNPNHVKSDSVCVSKGCCVKQASADLGDSETQCTGYVNSEEYGRYFQEKGIKLDDNGQISEQ